MKVYKNDNLGPERGCELMTSYTQNKKNIKIKTILMQ